MIYETDTDKVLVYNGSSWLFVAIPQTEEIGKWIAFTPTQTNFTLGNGTSTWYYAKINKVVHVGGHVVWGSTTSLSGDWRINLPLTADWLQYTGAVNLRDAGTRLFTGSVHRQSTTEYILCHSESGNFGAVNATNPFTWTANDEMFVSLTYTVP
jgi:hypothetical protein